jgi:molybdopterin-guanine dinucleotide biosynthesis protein A
VVEDRHDAKGPLAGMVAGFEAVRKPLVLVASCDAPLLRPELVGEMARLAAGHDIVLPHANGHPQPLLAIYRVATCLPNFEAAVERDDLKITRAYAGLDVRVIHERELIRFDPRLLSFMNANTPDALETLEPLARALGEAV